MWPMKLKDFCLRGATPNAYHETGVFEFISTGGYYHCCPMIARTFIDRAAEAQRAMGFGNEKDHPEVAPSQFEMNSATRSRDCHRSSQLYKLLAGKSRRIST